jgi:hypothetical protein
MFEGPVVGLFGSRRKTAGRKLPHLEMIGNAAAAIALFFARLVCTVTDFQIRFSTAFHESLLSCLRGALLQATLKPQLLAGRKKKTNISKKADPAGGSRSRETYFFILSIL